MAYYVRLQRNTSSWKSGLMETRQRLKPDKVPSDSEVRACRGFRGSYRRRRQQGLDVP